MQRQLPLFDSLSGVTDKTKHNIRLKENTVPIKQRYRFQNPRMQAIINEEFVMFFFLHRLNRPQFKKKIQ